MCPGPAGGGCASWKLQERRRRCRDATAPEKGEARAVRQMENPQSGGAVSREFLREFD